MDYRCVVYVFRGSTEFVGQDMYFTIVQFDLIMTPPHLQRQGPVQIRVRTNKPHLSDP